MNKLLSDHSFLCFICICAQHTENCMVMFSWKLNTSNPNEDPFQNLVMHGQKLIKNIRFCVPAPQCVPGIYVGSTAGKDHRMIDWRRLEGTTDNIKSNLPAMVVVFMQIWSCWKPDCFLCIMKLGEIKTFKTDFQGQSLKHEVKERKTSP